MTQPTPTNVVIVTTANQLRQIVAEEVERAMRRDRVQAESRRATNPEWITEREAQKLYGRSRSTLARWRKAGTVPHTKIGGSVYYRRPASKGDGTSTGVPP